MANTWPGRGEGARRSWTENGRGSPGAPAAQRTNSGHRAYTAWGSAVKRPSLARSTSIAPPSVNRVRRPARLPVRNCGLLPEDLPKGSAELGDRVDDRARGAERDMAVRTNEHRAGGGDLAVLQPRATHVDVVDVTEADAGGPQRNAQPDGDLLSRVDPVTTVLARDQHEVAIVHQRSEWGPYALALDPRVRQRAARLGARLVDPHRIDPRCRRRPVVDDRGGAVAVAVVHALLAKLDAVRRDGLTEGVAPGPRVGHVIP